MQGPKSTVVPRRSRVQGGWASKNPSSATFSKNSQCQPLPKWTGHNVDMPKPSTVQFTQPDEEELGGSQMEIELLSSSGVYDLSDGPSGTSRVRIFQNFLDPIDADQLFSHFLDGVPWEQKSDVKSGAKYVQPRMVAWFGDQEYSYSGLTHPARAIWLPELRELQKQLEACIGQEFNCVLCNLYRDGKDNIAWHSDDESLFGTNPTIASLSFGDTRNFELRRKLEIDQAHTSNPSKLYRIPLTHGSLVVMEGATQLDWQHRVPSEYHDRGPRINLTYRKIVTGHLKQT